MAPRSVLGILALFGVILLIKGRFKPEKITTTFDRINTSMLFVIGVGLVWVFAIEAIGFVVTSFVCFFAIMYAFHPKKGLARVVGATTVSVGVVVVLYLIFAKLLVVALPTGLLL
jgi:hypothetical protein